MFFNREKKKEQFRRVISGEPNLVYFVYGPINSGKTSLVCKVLEELPDEYVVFYINLRRRDISETGDFLNVLFTVDKQNKTLDTKEYLKILTQTGTKMLKGLTRIPIPEEIFEIIFESNKRSEDVFNYLEELFVGLKEKGKIPIFILDELQMIKEVTNGNGKSKGLLKKLFNFYVGMTKETHICHSIAITSDSLFIEETYNNARLEDRAGYFLVDDPEKDEVYQIYEKLGYKDKELIWEYFGGRLGTLIRGIEYKKVKGYSERELIKEFLQDEVNRIKELFVNLKEKYGEARRKELKEYLSIFKEKEEIQYEAEKMSEYVKIYVRENVLFYNAPEGTVKPQSRLIKRAIEEIFKNKRKKSKR